MNSLRHANRATALLQGEDEDQEMKEKKDALTILLECQQWALQHAPKLMHLVQAVKTLTGHEDIMHGMRSMYLPNWICFLAKAVQMMMSEKKQLEEHDVLLPPSVLAEVAIRPIRRRWNDGDRLINMATLFWLSTCKSSYHPSWIKSLEQKGKTPTSHMQEKMANLQKNYAISLETLMQRLKDIHLGMEKSIPEDQDDVVEVIDLDHEEDNKSALDPQTEANIKYYAWANDLDTRLQLYLFNKEKKQKALTDNLDHNHNPIQSNTTP